MAACVDYFVLSQFQQNMWHKHCVLLVAFVFDLNKVGDCLISDQWLHHDVDVTLRLVM